MSRQLFLAALLSLFASTLPAADKLKKIEVGVSPESVCRGFDGKLFVSIINGEKPGDGSVAVVDGEKVSTFATGLDDPKGIVFVGGYLVTADGTTLWKIDSKGEKTKLVEGKDFPAPIEFLNDVAASKTGKGVYVSEMSNPGPMFDPSKKPGLWDLESDEAKNLPKKGCVYHVSLEGKVTTVAPFGHEELRFPNGLAVQEDLPNDHLFIGDFFSGEVMTFADGKFTIAGKGFRGVDGLTVTADTIYASSWYQGKVWKYDRKSGKSEVLIEGLKSAADFYYDAEGKQLILPDMLSGVLIFLPL